MNKGEIWWANLPNPRGSEPGYKRPILIMQSDSFNRSKINTVLGAIITSNIGLADAPGNVIIPAKDSNLKKESVINVSQIITVDKSFLTKCEGTLPKHLMAKVNDGLRLVLDL